MMYLSTRSSNAIKLFPGKGRSFLLDSGKKEGQALLSGVYVTQRFFQKSFLYLKTLMRSPEAILIFLSSLCVLFALLSFRTLDDNRLTSWQWVFAQSDLVTTSLFLIAGIMLAWYLSAIELSRQYTLTSLFLLSYLIGILHWDSPEVIVDAARYFTQAKYIELYGIGYFVSEWGRGIMTWTDLPLVPFIYGLLFKVAGESRTGIQVINTFFFSGSVIITYLIGRELWNERVGLYGAAMLLAIPYLHTQVPLMLVDVPAMFFLSLAVLTYIRALTRKDLMLPVLASVCIALAMLTKYSNWLMLSILPIISLVLTKATINHDYRKIIFRQSFLVLINLSILMGLLMLWKYEIFSRQIGLLMEFQLPALSGWSESHLSTFLFQVHPFVSIAALTSLYFAFRKRDIKYLIIAWMLTLILVLDISRIRYVLIAFPMLALMAGYALLHINCARIRRYLAMCIVVSASVFSIFGYASFLKTTSASNIQHAGEYVDSLDGTVVEVVALPQDRSSVNPILSIPLFDLVTNKQVIYRNDQIISNKQKAQWMERSPLRFSWEYDLPSYYLSKDNSTDNIVVVISDNKNQYFPKDIKDRLAGHYPVRRFEAQEKVFLYTTIVDVYVPVQSKNKGVASL